MYISGVYVGEIYLHKLVVKIPLIIRGKTKGFTTKSIDIISKYKKDDLIKYESDKIKTKLKLKEAHAFSISSCETIITNKSYKEHSKA